MNVNTRPFKLLIFDWEGTLAFPGSSPSRLYPDTVVVLSALKEQGYLLAVATAKSKQGLAQDLHRLNLHTLISATCTAEETHPKPNPEMVFNILNQLAIVPQDALMIGDTVFDLDMARQAKIKSVAVTYGLQTREELLTYGPCTCVDELTQLPLWLAQLGTNT